MEPIVERVDLYRIVVPLRRRYVTANTDIGDRHAVLVAASSQGITGWGEASPVPGYSAESIPEVWTSITEAAVALPGGSTVSVSVPGVARGAIETALQDLATRRRGEPLWKALGATGEPVPVTAVIGLRENPNDVVAEIRRVIADGYRSVKLKIRPGWDLAPLDAARSVSGDIHLGADANGSYSSAAEVPSSIDEFDLVYLEQPIAPGSLEEHRRLQDRMTTPVCLDEDAVDSSTIDVALGSGAARAVAIKPGRIGGTGPTLDALEVVTRHGASARIGGMLETSVGRSHLLALASLPGFDLPGDISPPDRYLRDDPATGSWTVTAGSMRPSSQPGTGTTIDQDALDRLMLEHRAFP